MADRPPQLIFGRGVRPVKLLEEWSAGGMCG